MNCLIKISTHPTQFNIALPSLTIDKMTRPLESSTMSNVLWFNSEESHHEQNKLSEVTEITPFTHSLASLSTLKNSQQTKMKVKTFIILSFELVKLLNEGW